MTVQYLEEATETEERAEALSLSGLLRLLDGLPETRALLEHLQGALRAPRTERLIRSARAYVLAGLLRHLTRPVLVVVPRPEEARRLVEELLAWTETPDAIHLLLDPGVLPFERAPWPLENRGRRLAALAALAQAAEGPARVLVVASVRALMHRTLPPREMRLGLRRLRVGQHIQLGELLERWVAWGYSPVDVVEEPGTFSRRGGIVDCYPPNARHPVRMELFGSQVDSLRLFDPSTQRTFARVQEAWIGPAREALPRFGPVAAEKVAGIPLEGCHPVAQGQIRQDLERLQQGASFPGMELYLPYLYEVEASALDYLPREGLLVVEDPLEVEEAMAEALGQAEELHRELVVAGDLPERFASPYVDVASLLQRLREEPRLFLSSAEEPPVPGELAYRFHLAERYGGQLKRVAAEVQRFQAQRSRVVLLSRQASRLRELLDEAGVAVAPSSSLLEPPAPGGVVVARRILEEGWVLDCSASARPAPGPEALYLLTDGELFGWARPKPRRARRPRAVAPEAFFADLQPGDYVVHIEHGIGRFLGLATLNLDGVPKEYILVEYAAGDRLYVPVHQADRLSRYVGLSEEPPTLHRLGTADWEQVKARAREAVDEIAQELLDLYATRAVVQGHAFSPDTPWQRELEAAFPYLETEDQLHAIEAVKADMEREVPMDRLICGDVGYGKTEVALRAAFKAVMDGKQVAVLVPTTVLAQQHFKTFQERLAPFPVEVEMLSRFRARARQKEILRRLEEGSVDIVIGTHRLLQKDVRFKDLGLVIIDEEQRFGVAHKERLKQLRKEVDVLTLTATPIPRTLHLSLTGVRDMSTIETPPEERLPVWTVLAEYDDALVRQAIRRELDRGGQVYFVHDRVQGIEQMAARVQNLVPEARVAVAHGQMPEKDLERVMLQFANGEVDVLVCTTIIESGLDIPNANTILINRAHRFGLAQLYQLRGRVGRSAVRAYAYLLIPKHYLLSPVERRRLEAVVEARDLGAGFHIAMRDLEIRGAGEILGARQHGHIAAVGFDLYCRLLAEAVRRLRQEREEGRPAEAEGEAPLARRGPGPRRRRRAEASLLPLVSIELPLQAYIPADYVPSERLRLQLYRRLASVQEPAQVKELESELQDRFGPLPEPVQDLLYQLRLKTLALAAGAQAVTQEEGQFVVHAESLEQMNRERLQQVLGDGARVQRRRIWVQGSDQPAIWQARLLRVLEAMARELAMSSQT
ncbi:MAG: transcription-repair coupling factor [Anaerolineae bacterium]